MKILVCEDTFQYQQEFKRVLEAKEGYEVLTATTLEDAKELMKNEEIEFDLGILDIKLSEAYDNKDGLVLAKDILNSASPFPVIIATGFFDEPIFAEEAKKLGIPLKYFKDKDVLFRNHKVFYDLVEEAYESFGLSPLSLEYISTKDRKIGIKQDNGIYEFYSKDEILYLEADGAVTYFYLTNNRRLTLTRHLGYYVKKHRSHYINMMRVDSGHLINTELIVTLNGNIITFFDGSQVELKDAGKRRLKKNHLLM